MRERSRGHFSWPVFPRWSPIRPSNVPPEVAGREGASVWLDELVWREFDISVPQHFLHVRCRSVRPKYFCVLHCVVLPGVGVGRHVRIKRASDHRSRLPNSGRSGYRRGARRKSPASFSCLRQWRGPRHPGHVGPTHKHAALSRMTCTREDGEASLRSEQCWRLNASPEVALHRNEAGAILALANLSR